MVRQPVLLTWLVIVVGLSGCQFYDSSLLDPPRAFDAGVLDPGDVALPSGGDGDGALPQLPDVGVGDGGAASDAGADGSFDSGLDGGGLDAGADGGLDGGRDAGGLDGGVDGGLDAGGLDAAVDLCPGDPNKTAPGVCGCGASETCAGLRDALVHRYRFEGGGSALVDTVAGADGVSDGSQASGSLSLAGGSYARLPSGILSAHTAVTLELWLTWPSGSASQRALSFGTATPTPPGGHPCVGGPEYHLGSWYLFCQNDNNSTTWPVARGVCEGAGGQLASIESVAEDQYLDAHPNFATSVWIGANDRTTEGQWYFSTAAGLEAGPHFWSGDENGGPVAGAFADWRGDEAHPSDADTNTDCAFIYKATNSWMSWGCESASGDFVCEWRGHQGAGMDRGLWFTPADGGDRPRLSLETGGGTVALVDDRPFPTGGEAHVALVLGPAGVGAALYVDGRLAASDPGAVGLSELRDVDNWLGRSHRAGDPAFAGSLSELRVHARALTEAELVTSHAAGPDPAFLE